MEEAYFPLFVNLQNKKILVAGGGTIAARRVETLCSFSGNITVVAPEMKDSLVNLEKEGKIHCKLREYKKEDILGADIVLAATNNKEVNRKIAKDCHEAEYESGNSILVNVADDRTLCDFYFPAVIQKDEIVIGINSGGNSPGKVKKIRIELEEELKKEWEE